MENRHHERAKAKSILVSLTNPNQQITGFLRDISEGGLKIQKISAERQVETGDYDCHFVLPDFGKIDTKITVIGTGDSQEKFGELLIRMRFCDLDPESQEKIKLYVKQFQS
jgi:c-di-GMP-binding flagellar brake protein YcgR